MKLGGTGMVGAGHFQPFTARNDEVERNCCNTDQLRTVNPRLLITFAAVMRIAILSDPNNFHTQKWAKALQSHGAEIVVMSYDADRGSGLNAIQLTPPVGRNGNYSYWDYLRGGPVLRASLMEHRIDVVNPLNITPFGVWAMQAGFHPTVACAFGADILEYPPRASFSPATSGRLWESVDAHPSLAKRLQTAVKRRFFRKKVSQALHFADLVTGDNQFLVESMRDWFGLPPSKLEILRWGVEPQLFDAAPDALEALRNHFGILPGQKVVLSPRGAKPIYQTDIVLSAIEAVLASGRKDTVFIQLGAGYAVAPAVAAQAAQLAKRFPEFHFEAAALSRETAHALWRLVDLFISVPIYDGYSAALAEGRYVGAIPVVNDIPAHRELIVHDHNGWICHPLTAQRLAQDLQGLLDDCTAYRDKFAEANREWILANSLMTNNANKFMALLQHRLLP